ncbi:MAG: DNA-binding protein WhiA [Coprobacillus sp.]|nr:DNA-binding protein WhiA [Coprobacillus sp.]
MANTEVYSFTQKVKEEIVDNDYPSLARLKALLSAYIRINGKIVLSEGKERILLTTTNGKIARFMYLNISKVFSADCHMLYEKKKRFSQMQTDYLLYVNDKVEEILSDLDLDPLEEKISKNIAYNDDTICGFLAGSFLASGSINSPTTSNYHLEIVVNDENFAKWFLKLLQRFKGAPLEAKVITRRNKFVIYFKKSEQISNFLIVIGAVSSCLEFENIRVDRDVVNSANRLTNFDVANMKRTVESGQNQIKKIQVIDQYLGIENISNERAKMLCKLRLEHESASMSELATLLGEELDKSVSRSTIYNLFKYLDSLYERITIHGGD